MSLARLIEKLPSFHKRTAPNPLLSVVVVVFNMRREAPRTLFSLSSLYQHDVSVTDYEVIVVDNGSSAPLTAEEVIQFGPNFRYLWIDHATPSPASAINQGVALSNAPFVGIMIDGARIATPGVIALALQGLQGFKRAVVGTVGFHLGPDTQMYSLRHGYNQSVEDALLARIDWQHHGYRLFEIASQAGSSPLNWLGNINESNLIFLPRALFDELGGYDERFVLPGGGIVNLDFYRRAGELPNSTLLTLFGETTFHQVHGGIITNQPASELPQRLQAYDEEHIRIRGVPFKPPTRPSLLYGYPRPEITPWLRKACEFAAQSWPVPDRVPAREISAFNPAAKPPTLPFYLLMRLGLSEHHYLLELGSGALPASRSCIPYLQPSHYFAINFTERPTWEEIADTLGTELIKMQQPRFKHDDDFNLDVFGAETGFDFIVAPALLSHADLSQIRRCLASVRRILKPSGLLISAFAQDTPSTLHDEELYSATAHNHWTTITGLCVEAGLHCRKLDWPHPEWTWFMVTIDWRRLDTHARPNLFQAATKPDAAEHQTRGTTELL